MSDESRVDNEKSKAVPEEATVALQAESELAQARLLGAGFREPDGTITCALCGYECEWEECSACGGEGGYYGYEEDPLWYQPGEIAQCPQCAGGGGDWWCDNRECQAGQVWKITNKPKAPNGEVSRSRK